MSRSIARILLLVIPLLLPWIPAEAQVQIDKHRAVPAGDTVVRISNAFGRINVTAWDKSEVWVKGTVAAGAEGFDMDSGPADAEDDDERPKKKVTCTGVDISVAVPDAWTFESDDDTDYRSVLDVYVPRSSRLEIESTNAPVTTSGTTGSISVETVNGTVKVAGGGREVELKSLTGDVEYVGTASGIGAETVSGAVKIEVQTAKVQVRTVKGSIAVKGKTLPEVGIETTAGNVTLEGSVGLEGSWGIETFSGNVSILFPQGASGRFRCKTAEGVITSNVGPKPRRPERFQPFRVLEFRTGSGEAEIEIETYSGAINLKVPESGSPAPM